MHHFSEASMTSSVKVPILFIHSQTNSHLVCFPTYFCPSMNNKFLVQMTVFCQRFRILSFFFFFDRSFFILVRCTRIYGNEAYRMSMVFFNGERINKCEKEFASLFATFVIFSRVACENRRSKK